MKTVAQLTGQLSWRLEPAPATLTNERPDLVQALTAGRAARELPALLSALFSMCAHAHRLTASRAIDAAQGVDTPLTPAQQRHLQIETLREHLRRLWLDWPRLIRVDDTVRPRGLLELAHCPVLRGEALAGDDNADAALVELREWLERYVFAQPMSRWLGDWHAGGDAALSDWVRSRSTLASRLLLAAQPLAQSLRLPAQGWHVGEGSDGPLRHLADQLEHQPATSRQPTWQGAAVETGPWTRLHAPWCKDSAPSLWWRLGARLADIAHLAAPDDEATHGGRHWLATGTLQLGEHAGLAWTEMARGVLLHWVRLGSADAQARVSACRVVSPTEWNFHAHGVVAQALAAPGQEDMSLRLRMIPMLVAAYDPCVPLVVTGAADRVLLTWPPAGGAARSDEEASCMS